MDQYKIVVLSSQKWAMHCDGGSSDANLTTAKDKAPSTGLGSERFLSLIILTSLSVGKNALHDFHLYHRPSNLLGYCQHLILRLKMTGKKL